MLVGRLRTIYKHISKFGKASIVSLINKLKIFSSFMTSDLVGTADLHQMRKAWSSGLWTTLSTVRLAVRDPEAVSGLESATFRDI